MIYEDFVEKAKDEIIAYFSEGKFNESYSALRYHQYQWRMDDLKRMLGEISDMPEETKRVILDIFIGDRRRCFEAIKRIKLVAEKMDEQSNNGVIDRDKAEALLRNTPGTKIHRLTKYTGLTADEVDRVIEEKDQEAINELNSILSISTDINFSVNEWWDQASRARDLIKQQLPIKALPTLLTAVSKWSEQSWTSNWTEEAILLTKDYIKTHGVTEVDSQKIKQTMDDIILRETGVKDFEESVKFAKETLDLLK